MNPFLYDTVAAAHPIPPSACRRRPLARPVRRNWARALGSLALATGMSMAAAPAHALDVNTATADQLSTVRGLGPRTAAIIIKERERGGRFESMEDLSDRVRGIGQRKAQALQAAGLQVQGTPAPVPGQAARPAGGTAGVKAGDAGSARQRTQSGVAAGMRGIR